MEETDYGGEIVVCVVRCGENVMELPHRTTHNRMQPPHTTAYNHHTQPHSTTTHTTTHNHHTASPAADGWARGSTMEPWRDSWWLNYWRPLLTQMVGQLYIFIFIFIFIILFLLFYFYYIYLFVLIQYFAWLLSFRKNILQISNFNSAIILFLCFELKFINE